MADEQNIVISVVCYNNEDEVIAFAKAIAEQTISDRIFLLITCNSVKEYGYLVDELEKIDLKTFLYNPGTNLGYLNGCLYGVTKTKLPSKYWLTICNTDLIFESKSFFENIIKDVDKDTWCIGPNIVLKATGKSQNPFFKFRPSKKSMQIRNFAYSHFFSYKIYFKLADIKGKVSKKSKEYNSQYVYAVHGSCFIVSSDMVPLLGDIGKNVFMYGEEILVAEIIYENEKKTYFNSSITVIHNENQVTGKIPTKKKQEWFSKSTKYICKRFFSKKRDG